MTETTIQLPEVNVATVTQWFSRRCRSQEQQVLKQGIPAPDAPMAGPEQLLVAMQKGASLFPGSLAEPHTFVLPPNTAPEEIPTSGHLTGPTTTSILCSSLPCTDSTLLNTIHGTICAASSSAWTLTGCAWKLSDDASQHAIAISYSGTNIRYLFDTLFLYI
ncbi:hypothetical protein JOQ06_010329 [Pogonophryne albipinna]|uniref:Uncharacterized protein n=1 Tax=Pogonophryne albipinna TaxID=1090488 RepID=A0AAD6AVM4_9TELE|nr:hypothetical protein JOQ06_010329 [Pogonophryne albipinna]